MTTLPVYIYHVDTPEGPKDYVSCLSNELVLVRGLPPQAIIGVLLRPLEPVETITPESFARNRVFVDFMHAVIGRRAPQLPGLVAEAQRQKNGFLYVIDQRTPTPGGAVPPEDIVGAFAVRDGLVAADSYQPNPNHSVLSSAGFFQLGPELQPCLLEELAALA